MSSTKNRVVIIQNLIILTYLLACYLMRSLTCKKVSSPLGAMSRLTQLRSRSVGSSAPHGRTSAVMRGAGSSCATVALLQAQPPRPDDHFLDLPTSSAADGGEHPKMLQDFL